jgi:hypothetical protein
MQLPVLFRDEPVVPCEHTAVGIGMQRRAPGRRRHPAILAQLIAGPCLAAFDLGIVDDAPAHEDGDTVVVEVPC